MNIPTIDNSGNVVFRAQVTSQFANGGVHSAFRSSSSDYIAQAGDPVPGLPDGAKFRILSNVQTSPGGSAAFVGYVEENDWRQTPGFWSENRDGSLRMVARVGTRPSGAPEGVTLLPFDDRWADSSFDGGGGVPPFTLNAHGEVAFYSRMQWPGYSNSIQGIWSEGGGRGLRLVARTGMPVPQFKPGASIYGFMMRYQTVPLNDRGQSTFVARLEGPDVVDALSSALFVDDPAQGLIVAVRSGQQAPGYESGVRFGGFSVPTLNNAGLLVFISTLVKDDAVSAYGIWAGTPDHLRSVAQIGDAAPGVDGRFSSIWPLDYPVINGKGHVAFTATVAGPGIDESNDAGIWAEDEQGRLRLLAKESDIPANPYVPDDWRMSHLIFNNRGQVAFGAARGIWATDMAGRLHEIIHEGDLLPPDSIVTGYPPLMSVTRLGMGPSTGNEEGLGTSFNDRGELVFYAGLANGPDGVYLSRAVAIPEPATEVLLLLGVVVGGGLRRRL